MTLILGVDPGLPQCAYSIWRDDKYVDSNVFRFKDEMPEAERLSILCDLISGVYADYSDISKVYIEGVWYRQGATNIKTLVGLIHSHVPWMLMGLPVEFVPVEVWRGGMGCPYRKRADIMVWEKQTAGLLMGRAAREHEGAAVLIGAWGCRQ